MVELSKTTNDNYVKLHIISLLFQQIERFYG